MKDWVSASTVGEHAFCPESVRLSMIGETPSDEAKLRRQAGEELHIRRRLARMSRMANMRRLRWGVSMLVASFVIFLVRFGCG